MHKAPALAHRPRTEHALAAGGALVRRSGSPSVATVTEKQKQGVLLLIRATQALYDTAGAHGYQRREGKIATFPF